MEPIGNKIKALRKKADLTQEEFSKMVVENIPLGVAVFQKDMNSVLKNSYLTEKINIGAEALVNLLAEYKRNPQISATREGGYSCTRSFNNSNPIVYFST